MAVLPADIATELGVEAPTSGSVREAQFVMWIGDAERAIARRATLLGTTSAALDQDDVDEVVRKAVVAHAQNPSRATQVTISVDDATTSKTYQSGSGELSIDDEWWAILGLTIAAATGAYSVPLGSPWYQP